MITCTFFSTASFSCHKIHDSGGSRIFKPCGIMEMSQREGYNNFNLFDVNSFPQEIDVEVHAFVIIPKFQIVNNVLYTEEQGM